MNALLLPPVLEAGARIALIAPAGPLREGDLERAMHNVRSFGFEPVAFPHAEARTGYFAGSDARRLADFNAALARDDIDALWCLRGGYGAMRLLEKLDYDALVQRPRAIIGYSDITALHAAIGIRAGLAGYHGPTARAKLTDFSRDSLLSALHHEESCGDAPEARMLRPGTARGRLAGGNLALLAALCGTPFMPDLRGAILVLEDINEAVYRVDRMLTTLHLAGALDGCVANTLGVPCLAGIPLGHIADQWTIPLGALAELNATARRLTVLSSATTLTERP